MTTPDNEPPDISKTAAHPLSAILLDLYSADNLDDLRARALALVRRRLGVSSRTAAALRALKTA